MVAGHPTRGRWWRHRSTSWRRQRGSVTAEAAIVLPLVAGVALCLMWMISVGIAQVEVVDAARDAARAVARGDDTGHAAAAARATAPSGAEVAISTSGDSAIVTVPARRPAPGWLLIPLPDITVRSTSAVRLEANEP